MDLGVVALKLLSVLALIAANGFFVAAEFSLVSMRSTRIDQLVDEGNRMARFIQRAKKNPNPFLTAAQIGITLASLALGWVAEPTIATLIIASLQYVGAAWGPVVIHAIAAVLTFILITYLHIVLGENIPKALALQRTEATSMLTALPMEWLTIAFKPFIAALNRSGQWMLTMMGIQGEAPHGRVYSEEELKRLLAASHEEGVLEAAEKAMLDKVFEFSDKVARDVMIPRPDIKMVPVDTSLEDLLATIKLHGFTRYPVYGRDADEILGFVHLKDVFGFLIRHAPADFKLTPMLRKVLFVPETKPIPALLEEFRQSRNPLAIVMDEYGGTSGMVTPQDLAEEILGTLGDEFAVPHTDFVQLSPGHYRISGRYRIDAFNERFATDIPADEYDTMAGWVFGTLGREAQPGDQVEFLPNCFTVEQVEGHRITSILVEICPTEEGEQISREP